MTTTVRKPAMKVAIIGSRDYPALDRVRQYIARLPADWTIVSGGARGVDQAAAKAAHEQGLHLIEHPADWSLGRGAGFQRNHLIVNDCDYLVAFWDGVSRGTQHSISLAQAAGKRVYIVT